MIPRLLRARARMAAATLVAVGAVAAAAPPARAVSYVAISGSGSSWSAVALDQWQQDLRPSGLVINYNPDGSAAGRGDYMANQDDFAASDPPFRNGQDQLGGTGAEHPTQGYSYIPDTAGGTAFMYHIDVAGKLVTNLRLSGLTLMKIFTGAITNWDDPAITRDYGAQLPSLPITPVIRSDGSGATFFFTRWMAHMFPAQWNAFCQKVKPGIRLPCGQTEFYPLFGNAKSENGSNNVATYITASYGNGSIGYDEYAYALNSHYPVVKLLNPAGYYVLPTASNVAVALTQAQINENPASPDFLQQNLDSVYTYTDPRSYPLSSYSYLIVPRAGSHQPTNFTAAKGRTLSTFVDYLLCSGQREVAALGYSPLPLNLVKGGLLQNSRIPGAVPGPSPTTLAGCSNPTFTGGQLTLLTTAPQPSPCDKLGEPLDCVVVNGKAATPGAAGTSPSADASPGAASPSGGAIPAGPVTGTSGPSGPQAPLAVTPVVVNVAASGPSKLVLSVLTALAIVCAVILPPALGGWLRRRRRQGLG
ncbi:MAG TPA: substrate-binding domain-containing protein [Streptosporangiaceae bacterium]